MNHAPDPDRRRRMLGQELRRAFDADAAPNYSASG
jgi:hypothetical protein